MCICTYLLIWAGYVHMCTYMYTYVHICTYMLIWPAFADLAKLVAQFCHPLRILSF